MNRGEDNPSPDAPTDNGADRIVSLRGDPVPLPIPDDDIIARLERMLALAKDGQLKGLGLIYVAPDGSVTTGWNSGGYRHALLGGIGVLQHRLASAIHEDDGE